MLSDNTVIQTSSAEFTLTSTDADCSVIITNGNFLVGTALTANENMQVEIDVTATGDYTYTTDTLNGYYFSAAGKFETTGKQFITLAGHGTPQTPGNSRFSFRRTISEMHQTVAVTDPDLALETVPGQIYVKGKFGDDAFHVIYPIDVDNVSYGGGYGDTATFASFVNPGIYPNPAGTGAISLQKQHMFHFNSSTEADFKEFFKPGAYPISFYKCDTYPLSNGIWIAWLDDNNDAWLVRKDLDQSGSSFKIVALEDGHTANGRYFVKVKSRFNCKLYKSPGNEMKELKDVEMVSYFIRPN